jgi:hypothetical protein
LKKDHDDEEKEIINYPTLNRFPSFAAARLDHFESVEIAFLPPIFKKSI